jgi:hypothetical protein
MTTFYSTWVTNYNTVPRVLNAPYDQGKIRFIFFTYTQAANGAAGDKVVLCRLPPGKVRFLGGMSWMDTSLTPTIIDLGYQAHTNRDGTAVVADEDGWEDGVDWTTDGLKTGLGSLKVGYTQVFDSKEGVAIVITLVTGTPTAANTIDGCIVYGVE